MPFLIVSLNKIGILESEFIYNFSIAQIIIGSFSSIYLYRFPDEKIKKIGLEIFIVISLLLITMSIFNTDFGFWNLQTFIIITLLCLKDLSRIATLKSEINYKLFVVSSILLLGLLYYNEFILIFAFTPLILILSFQEINFIKFSRKIKFLKIKYFIEDLPIHGSMFILTIQSYNILDNHDYDSLRFIVALSSFSGILQYLLFYVGFVGVDFKMFSLNNKTLLSLLPMIIISILYIFGIEVVIVGSIIISGFYYFIIKSIYKLKFLLLNNLLPLLCFLLYNLLYDVNLNTYYSFILLSSLTPIFYFIYESYRKKI